MEATAQGGEQCTTGAAFAAGCETWFEVVKHRSFDTSSLEPALTEKEVRAIIAGQTDVDGDDDSTSIDINGRVPKIASVIAANPLLQDMERRIDAEMGRKGWKLIFIKLSTRSPKDSPVIAKKAIKQFEKEVRDNDVMDPEVRAPLFFDLIQRNLSVKSGGEAMDYMLTSKRVTEDCEQFLKMQASNNSIAGGSFKNADGDDLSNFGLQLREYKDALPLNSEFRAIIWKGRMTALWQYFHAFKFPEYTTDAQAHKLKHDIVTRLNEVYETELKDGLNERSLDTCVLDFAYVDNADNPKEPNIYIIEVNPFDPDNGIGTAAGSMGLFDWEKEADKEVIKNRKTELPEFRVREEVMDMDGKNGLKMKMNSDWRDYIFPTWQEKHERQQRLKAAAQQGKGAGKALPLFHPTKGKGKGKGKVSTSDGVEVKKMT